MKEAVTDAQERPGFPLRSFRSLQDGDENRGQLSHSCRTGASFSHVESICRNGVYDATLATWRRKQFIPMSGWVMCI